MYTGYQYLAKKANSFLSTLQKPLSYIWKATKKFANDVYNATVETLQDVREIVRSVLNEEAYNMFLSAAETLQSNVVETGMNKRCIIVYDQAKVGIKIPIIS